MTAGKQPRNDSTSTISSIDRMTTSHQQMKTLSSQLPKMLDDSTEQAFRKINVDLFLQHKQIMVEQYNLLKQYQLHYDKLQVQYDKLYRKFSQLRKVKFQ